MSEEIEELWKAVIRAANDWRKVKKDFADGTPEENTAWKEMQNKIEAYQAAVRKASVKRLKKEV